jgi:N-acetyl-gamma-glutamyl-phosphate reductase common form
MRIGVVGASGFMGGELVRLLADHPRAKLEMVAGGESAGKPLRDLRPGLDLDMTIEPADAETLARRCDVVFLALPHGKSADMAYELLERGCPVFDLGSDFRLRTSEQVKQWYGREAPYEGLLSEATYALPELTGGPPPTARLIACPGCFATGLALLLAPLTSLLQRGDRVSCFGITGSSGSGIQPAPGVHHSLRMTNFTAYKPLGHQHLGEVGQLLGDMGAEFDVDFVPHSAPIARGIHLTATVGVPVDQVRAAFEASYQGKPLIRLQDGPVSLGAVVGTCRVLIGFAGQGSQTAIFLALDNLLKGGSGQAVQNLNLWRGWPELEGLPVHGMWP